MTYTEVITKAAFEQLLTTAFATVHRDRRIGEIIYTQSVDFPALSEIATVDNNPIPGDPIPWMRPLEYGTVVWTECGQAPVMPKVTAGVTTYPSLVRLHSYIEKCFDELVPMLEKYRRRGNEWLNVEGTELARWIIDLFIQMRQTDQFRIAFFGDEGYAAGDLAEAGLLPHYNQLDGIYKIMSTQASGNADQKVTIAANGAASKTAQMDLSSVSTIEIFEGLRAKYEKQQIFGRRSRNVFSSLPNASRIYATFSLFAKYRAELETENQRFTTDVLENGLQRISYKGLDVTALPWLDEYIQTDFDNGTTYDRPHRAFIYNTADVRVGLDDPTAVNGAEAWYERKPQTYNIRGNYGMNVMLRDTHSFVLAE